VIKKFTKIFGAQCVYTSTNYFYQLLILNLWFSLMTLPWSFLNGIIKLTPTTYIFYLATALWILPNIQTVFQLFKFVDANSETIRFKEYWKQLWENFSGKMKYSFLVVLILGVLIGETYVILKVQSLRFLSPLFFVVLVFLSVSVVMAYYLTSEAPLNMREMIKMSLMMAWRNPIRSLLYFLILTLWISIGYWLPIVNLLLGNACFFYLLHVLFKRYLRKLFKKYA